MSAIGIDRDDLNYLFDILSVAALACNRRLREFLLEIEDSNKSDYSRSAIFYEFFFHQPIQSASKSSSVNNRLLLIPFLARLFIGWPTMPHPKGLGKSIPSTEPDLAILRPIQRLEETMFAKHLVEFWSLGTKYKGADFTCEKTDGIEPYKYGSPKLSRGEIKKELKKATKEKRERPPRDLVKSESLSSRIVFYSALHALLPDENLYHVLLPIGDKEVLFGQLWLGVPKASEPALKAQILQIISELHRIYVPVLALVHQHFWEWLRKKELGGTAKRKRFVSYENTFANPRCEENDDVLIRAFHRLAVARGEVLAGSVSPKEPKFWKPRSEGGSDEAVKKSLLFARYVIASPEMVKLLRTVISTGERLVKQGSSLPSVLVVGGAGSGKDTIAGLLRMFSNRYRNGQNYVVNMAAMKPDAVAAAAIVGAEKGLLGAEAPIGVLSHLRKDAVTYILTHARTRSRRKSLSEILKNIRTEAGLNGSRFPTLTLDELNSFPTEAQGVLLRFLENSEIVAIGSAGDKDLKIDVNKKAYSAKGGDIAEATNFLVVGIMNEDPDDLTMEDAIEALRSERYVGGAMGDWLYDVFSRARRLRADLKYRLVRDGKFRIPDLNRRREDIPILFYVAVRLAFESLYEKPQVFVISPQVYEELLTVQTMWPGNVRQLQAVARRCVENFVDEKFRAQKKKPKLGGTKKPASDPAPDCITTRHLKPVLKEMVLKADYQV
jgi:hypothetical protein